MTFLKFYVASLDRSDKWSRELILHWNFLSEACELILGCRNLDESISTSRIITDVLRITEVMATGGDNRAQSGTGHPSRLRLLTY